MRFWDDCDPTCIVLRHEHDWLWKEKSFVDYRYAHLRPHGLIVNGVRRQMLESRQDMNGQVFLRICRGIQTSPFTPGPIKVHHRTLSAAAVQAKSETTAGGTGPATRRRVDTSTQAS